MITKRRVDRVGGAGSVAVGLGCAWMGYRDWLAEHSLWKVWALMCIVLVLNGVAMIRYSLRKKQDRMENTPRGEVLRESSRV